MTKEEIRKALSKRLEKFVGSENCFEIRDKIQSEILKFAEENNLGFKQDRGFINYGAFTVNVEQDGTVNIDFELEL